MTDKLISLGTDLEAMNYLASENDPDYDPFDI